MEIALTQEQIIRESLSASGISKEFTNPQKSLKDYGAEGEEAAGMIFTQLGSSLILYGDSPRANAIFQLTCRGAILKWRKALHIYSLPTLMELAANRFWGGEEAEKLASLDIIAIKGFFDKTYKQPFSEENLFTLSWYLRERMDNGTILFVQRTDGMATNWWTDGLLQQINEKAISITVK